MSQISSLSLESDLGAIFATGLVKAGLLVAGLLFIGLLLMVLLLEGLRVMVWVPLRMRGAS